MVDWYCIGIVLDSFFCEESQGTFVLLLFLSSVASKDDGEDEKGEGRSLHHCRQKQMYAVDETRIKDKAQRWHKMSQRWKTAYSNDDDNQYCREDQNAEVELDQMKAGGGWRCLLVAP